MIANVMELFDPRMHVKRLRKFLLPGLQTEAEHGAFGGLAMTYPDLSFKNVLSSKRRQIIARSLLLMVAIVVFAQGANAYMISPLEPDARLADSIMTLKVTLIVGAPFTLYVNLLQARADLATEHFRILSRTDPLTGLLNRRAFLDLLKRRSDKHEAGHKENALLILDLDHFKKVNDDHGHDAGDSTLIQLAELFRANLRADDIVARLGGEEFAVALSRSSPRETSQVAQRLRKSVEDHPFLFDRRTIRMTVSIGLVRYSDADDLESAMRKADLLAYKSKKNGRNRVSYDDQIDLNTAD